MALFYLILIASGIFLYERPPRDWSDSHDPKFETKLYGDLEEGGSEGGDDD